MRRFFRVFRRRVYSIHRANSNTRVPRIVRGRRGRGGGQPWKSVQIKSESSSDPLSDALQHSWRVVSCKLFYFFIVLFEKTRILRFYTENLSPPPLHVDIVKLHRSTSCRVSVSVVCKLITIATYCAHSRSTTDPIRISSLIML